MRPTLLFLSAAIWITSTLATVDPFTVTSLTPEQTSRLGEAASSLAASLTAAPAFTSIIFEIATDTKALDALTRLLGPLPTGTQGEAEFNSIIDQLPPDAQSFIRSITSVEGDIVASVLSFGASVTGSVSATSTAATAAGSTTLKSQTTSNTLPASSSGQAATSVKNTPAGSTLTTLTGSSVTPNSFSTSATATQNVGALLQSGGLSLVLAILGAGIAVL